MTALLVVLVAAGLFTVWQALKVRADLLAARADLGDVAAALQAGDLRRASDSARSAEDHASAARSNSRGPLWWLGSKLPAVGDDVAAVRTVADVAHDLSAGPLPQLLDTAISFSQRGIESGTGRVNVPLVKRSQGVISDSANALRKSEAQVNTIDPSDLVGPLRGPVEGLQDQLSTAAVVGNAATRTVRILPSLLGGDGKRTYLVLLQNNAEVRAGGGLTGAVAEVSVDDGRLELVSQTSAAELQPTIEPTLALSREERALFTDEVTQFPGNVTANPDFPRAAEAMRAIWQSKRGTAVDGVFALDPLALSYVLRATGPITVDDVQLTTGNIVDVLLNETYQRLPNPVEQDEFFQLATQTVLRKITGGEFSAPRMMQALGQAATERRLLVWSNDAQEQGQLSPTAIGGAVSAQVTKSPQVGLYVNDSASDKLTYYLDRTLSVTPRSCGSTGIQIMDVRLVLRSAVPRGVTLAKSIVGPPEAGLPPGDMRLTTYLYGPVDGSVQDTLVDGQPLPASMKTFRGREVAVISIDLPRQSRRVIEYTVYSGRGQTAEPDVQTTPGVKNSALGEIGRSACASAP